MAKLNCPKCKGTNIQLFRSDANVKSEKTRTSVNLNPFKPFTLFNKKKKTKLKKSRGKKALSRMTGGASRLVVGTKDKRSNEYFCSDCGNRWLGK